MLGGLNETLATFCIGSNVPPALRLTEATSRPGNGSRIRLPAAARFSGHSAHDEDEQTYNTSAHQDRGHRSKPEDSASWAGGRLTPIPDGAGSRGEGGFAGLRCQSGATGRRDRAWCVLRRCRTRSRGHAALGFDIRLGIPGLRRRDPEHGYSNDECHHVSHEVCRLAVTRRASATDLAGAARPARPVPRRRGDWRCRSPNGSARPYGPYRPARGRGGRGPQA